MVDRNKTRVVSFSIKPRDVRGWLLVEAAKGRVASGEEHSFSTIMIKALQEYMEKTYDYRQ